MGKKAVQTKSTSTLTLAGIRMRYLPLQLGNVLSVGWAAMQGALEARQDEAEAEDASVEDSAMEEPACEAGASKPAGPMRAGKPHLQSLYQPEAICTRLGCQHADGGKSL